MDGLNVKGVGKVERAIPALPAGDVRQEAFERTLQLQLGKSMQVAVLARLGDGSFLVQVAGNQARMALPRGTQPGTEVPMTLVAASPRPTFQLSTAPGAAPVMVPLEPYAAPARGAAPSLGAVLLGKALAPAPGGQSDPDHGAVSASLSDIGRLLTRLLGKAPAGAGQAASITAPVALQGGAPEPAGLAHALHESISQSGLFYESHVAEWAEGKRGLPELLREPQMNGPRPGAPDTDPAAAQLVSQQLATHEQARLSWQGQVWPGQDMHWEIQKDAPDGGDGRAAGDAEPGWRSALRLRFPMLGEISATIVVANEQLHIQLNAGSGDTGALLRAHSARLSAALGTAGYPLSSLDIRASGQAGHD